MRYSKLFGKTLRTVPKEAEAKSHQLLLRAGFIDRALTSGIYTYLPLGWRVLKKIENIIREEMDAIGGQELLLPAMHPRELWEESGRWVSYVPPLFKLQDQHRRDLCLAPTHEEASTG
ncbi:MAG: proline--tRNA ligase, partial [Patescibacteria group bacterium]|nr:proline--tRNA ligase [Patescibacteria group bacterium]